MMWSSVLALSRSTLSLSDGHGAAGKKTLGPYMCINLCAVLEERTEMSLGLCVCVSVHACVYGRVCVRACVHEHTVTEAV